MANKKTSKKRSAPKGRNAPLTADGADTSDGTRVGISPDAQPGDKLYTQEEVDELVELEASAAANYIDDVNIRRYAIELATNQVVREMEYAVKGAPEAGNFEVYQTRAEEIIAYIRNGVSSDATDAS